MRLFIAEIPPGPIAGRMIDAARSNGFAVTLLTNRPDVQYSDTCDSEFSVVKCDIFSQGIFELIEKMKGDGGLAISTIHDRSLARCAQLAEHFGVPGFEIESIFQCSSKLKQKSVLTASGIPCPKLISFINPTGLDVNFEKLPYPVFAKPEYGYASIGVRLCRTRTELLEHISQVHALRDRNVDTMDLGRVLVEEVICGTEYCAELFNGVCVGVIEKFYISRGIHNVELGYKCGRDRSMHMTALAKSAEDAALALGVAWGATHVDLIQAGQAPFIIEVNPRVAGGIISTLISDVFGVDLLRQQIELAAGRQIMPVQACAQYAESAVVFIYEWEIPINGNIDFCTNQFDSYDVEIAPHVVLEQSRVARICVRARGSCNAWETALAVKSNLLRESCKTSPLVW